MKNILTNKWFKFGLIGLIYLLWVLWMWNFWFLPGLAVIYDVYISKKVHWAFWKKKGVKKQTAFVEWVDALIFAIVAATIIRMFLIEAYTIPTPSMEKSLLVGDYLFVSKYSYGPKMPNTPLSFPFVHNTMPGSKESKSYLEWIQNPYKRLAGLGEVERGDAIVFNFPEGDTVATAFMGHSYYGLCRVYGREMVWKDKRNFGNIITRPVDKRENYIKRCVAIAGDSLQIIDGSLYVNGKLSIPAEGQQFNYDIYTNGQTINPNKFDEFGISVEDYSSHYKDGAYYRVPMTLEMVNEMGKLPVVKQLTIKMEEKGRTDGRVFPHSIAYSWNEDNFGPLYVPAKGASISLNVNNLPLYERIIRVYEGNELRVEGNDIYINNQKASTYTFKMNYYWAMGDNRHNSADSRYWGFVPEDHLVGKAVFVWLSLDKNKSLADGKIRWSRLFHSVESLMN
ncbi:MAG: signal peptidase I [Bacteroidales bacterium]|nr:signal peptidase I [Bacteroidales bacterium]